MMELHVPALRATVASNLCRAREIRELTIAELAKRAGLSVRGVSKATKDGSIRLGTLDRIARGLAIPAWQLLHHQRLPFATVKAARPSKPAIVTHVRAWLGAADGRSVAKFARLARVSTETAYDLLDESVDTHIDRVAAVAAALGKPAWALLLPLGGRRGRS